MTHQARRSRRVFASPLARTSRRRLQLETLEDRSLLSGAKMYDLSSFRIDPNADIDHTRILVQFNPDLAEPSAQAILPGSRLGPAMKLVPGLREVTLPVGVSVTTALAAFSLSDQVEYAEPNYFGQINLIPDDPLYGSLYGMNQIRAPQAWDFWPGLPFGLDPSLPPIVAADMDTGANYDHPDLCANIWLNQGEIPASRLANLTDMDGDTRISFFDLNFPENQGAGKITDLNGDGGYICGGDVLQNINGQFGGWADGVDGDGNGRVDDLVGWDFDTNDRFPTDGHGHGTHTAGTIGAQGFNGVGVTGVTMYTQIMVLKINVGSSGSINLSAAIAAIDYAVQNGAVTSNNSWGGQFTSTPMQQALTRARTAGHIYVAAAGNNGININNSNPPFNPCSYGRTLDNVICVAATTSADVRASFSNYGNTTVHLAAPGNAILSTSRTGSYVSMSGTSMAAPHVTGAVAFLRSAAPNESYLGIKAAMLNNVDPTLPGLVISGGRLNLYNSLIDLWSDGFGYSDPRQGTPIDPVSNDEGTPTTLTAPAGLDNAGLVIDTLIGTEVVPAQPDALDRVVDFSPVPVADETDSAVQLSATTPTLVPEGQLRDDQPPSARAEVFPDDPLASL